MKILFALAVVSAFTVPKARAWTCKNSRTGQVALIGLPNGKYEISLTSRAFDSGFSGSEGSTDTLIPVQMSCEFSHTSHYIVLCQGDQANPTTRLSTEVRDFENILGRSVHLHVEITSDSPQIQALLQRHKTNIASVSDNALFLDIPWPAGCEE